MKRFFILFCTIIVVSIFRTTVYACKCVNTSAADVYCSSDFVIHAQLLEITHLNETLKKLTIQLTKYKVKISKIFKKSAKFVDDGFLYSAPTSCGVQLNISKNGANDYLFAGYVAQKRSFLHGCSWAKNWATEVDNSLKDSLEKGKFDERCPDRQIQ
uniref:NTR domain-containing protein n=1 Tax=Romanomermis culicivorax TaxID=13658 RepID=A0A915K587_ROMCU